jgi:hypothetical protein
MLQSVRKFLPKRRPHVTQSVGPHLCGRASDAQLEFLADMRKAGAQTAITVGLDAALATLEALG